MEPILTLISIVFALAVYILGFLDLKATVLTAAFFVLISITAPNWWITLTMIGYSAIIAATVLKHDEKEKIRGNEFASGKKRTYKSVVGKVAVPAAAAVLNAPGLFVSAIFFGVADSVANEIGVLSPNWPRLVTSWRKVKPGTNGGVSLLGTLAAMASSFLLGTIVLGLVQNEFKMLPFLFFSTSMGVLGCFIDSYIGAVLENRKIISGWVVNFLASLITGLIGNQLFPFLNY